MAKFGDESSQKSYGVLNSTGMIDMLTADAELAAHSMKYGFKNLQQNKLTAITPTSFVAASSVKPDIKTGSQSWQLPTASVKWLSAPTDGEAMSLQSSQIKKYQSP